MENKNNKNAIIVFLVVAIAILAYIAFVKPKNTNNSYQIPVGDTKYEKDNENSYKNITDTESNTYTYKNHGFTIELPIGFIPHEAQAEGGPAFSISLPIGDLSYVTDSAFWEKYNIPSYTYIEDKKIGETIFKVYEYSGATFYWFKKGNVGYQFGAVNKIGLENLIETFKFVGWSQ